MRCSPRLIAALAAAVLMGGCASDGAAPMPSPGQQRGYDLARRQCAGCHAIADESGPSGAPSLLRIGRRFNALTFERRIKEIAEGRHGLMPALQLTPDEAADLAAYIAALAVRPAPCNPSAESETCSR